jgi:hypothetical protein
MKLKIVVDEVKQDHPRSSILVHIEMWKVCEKSSDATPSLLETVCHREEVRERINKNKSKNNADVFTREELDREPTCHVKSTIKERFDFGFRRHVRSPCTRSPTHKGVK